MRKGMDHTPVSASQASSETLYSWQHGAKENYSKFETFKKVVKIKTNMIQIGLNILNVGSKMIQ